jgi:antitoxin HicB
MSMKFPARIDGSPGDYVLSFRDVPEAITGAGTLEEVKANALDCVVTAMDFYFHDRKLVPCPSPPQKGEFLVPLPVSIATKALSLKRMLETRTTIAD